MTRYFPLHQETKILAQDRIFDHQTEHFEFHFTLPENLIGSYDGYNGSIRYGLIAELVNDSSKVIEKEIVLFEVFQTKFELDEKTIRAVAEHEGEEILEVEIENQKYCIGDHIGIRYRVNTDMNFNTLRASIEHIENSSLEGAMTKIHKDILFSEEIQSENVIRHQWNDWILKISKATPPGFMHDNLKSVILLKVTIGRSYRFDKSAEIGLIPIHCSMTPQSPELRSLEDPIERPRPKRLRCKNCSYTFKPKDEDIDSATCPSCGKEVHF